MLKKRILILSILGFILPSLLIEYKAENSNNINTDSGSNQTQTVEDRSNTSNQESNKTEDKKSTDKNGLNLFIIISIVTHVISVIAIVIGFIALKNQSEDRQKMNDAFKTAFKESKNDIKDIQDNIEQIKGKLKRRDEKISLLKAELEKVNKQKKDIPTPPYNPNYPNYNQYEDSLRASLRDSYTNQPIQYPANKVQEIEFNNSNEQINNNLPQEPENILLAKEYNQDKTKLLSSGMVVTLTEESANKIFRQMWSGSIEFENNKQGEYFVVEGSNGEYYLFPCRNKNIDLRTIKNARLFTIIGDDEGIAKGDIIEIRNPAKVEKNGQYWRLLEEGDIKLN